jgi:signal transduction histidine kinase/ligand-binding sensor domain-containing protein/DNA-binding response OmpR family regulator
MLRKVLPLILLILSAGHILAQQNRISFEQLNLSEGLSHSLISGCAEDKPGFMWFATQDGIDRYDGYSFKVYQPGSGPRFPTSAWINNIYIDREDQIWIAYQGKGLNRLDTKTEIFYDYSAGGTGRGSISDIRIQPPSAFSDRVFYEDIAGNLWIGTQNGLNLYDRNTDCFKVYKKNPGDTSALSNNIIYCIKGDSAGKLWIGTRNGLNLLDPKTGKCRQYLKNSIPNSLSDTTINTLFVENDSTIWAGTAMKGLNIISLNHDQTVKSVRYLLTRSVVQNAEATINCIYRTRSGKMLAGMIGGLYEVRRSGEEWECFPLEKTLNSSISHIIEDPFGNILVSADLSKYLYRYSPDLSVCEEIPLYAKTFNEKKNVRVQFLYISKTGVLWIGTEKDGILKANLYGTNFHSLGSSDLVNPHLNNEEIYSVYEDVSGNLYVGTKEGLNVIPAGSDRDLVFRKRSENPKNITFTTSYGPGGDIIGAIKPQQDGKIWLGYFDYKISLFDPVTGTFKTYHHNPADPGAFRIWSLRSVCVTSKNEVYFGGTSEGLTRLNRDQDNFTYFPVSDHSGEGLSDGWINIITEDHSGILWIGTMQGGLNRFDPMTGEFRHYRHDPADKTSIGNNTVKCILEPRMNPDDILWIGTHGGLQKFSKKSGEFTSYDKKNGLPSNTIHGILEDEKGNLWISSNKGISCFDPHSGQVRNYSAEDGLQSDEFNEGAYFKNKKGIMFFGGVRGLTWFDPQELTENPFNARPVITGFSLFNIPVKPLDTLENRIILTSNISSTENITLTHRDRIISFEFSALNYVSPSKINFRYILEGFEKTVNSVDAGKRFASYTNIPTGEYRFKVWATNTDGIWSPLPASVKITVLPPFWERLWFKTLIVSLILLIFLAILMIRTRILTRQKKMLKEQVEERTIDLKKMNEELEKHQDEILLQSREIAIQRDNLKEQNQVLEKQKEEIGSMAKKLHEADELKLRFFTNISHEFRTPLTLILGPTENLLSRESYADTKKVRESLSLIYKNEKRLFRLINQLIEIRRVETGSLKLNVREDDMVPFLLGITELFEGLAKKNNINFSFITEADSLKFLFDADKIEKTVFNLLSNAFNHTPNGGAIILFLEQTEIEQKPWVLISVTDTGSGIPEKHLPYIFDRFYQLTTKSETGQISSGIGLSLCRDLIEKHKGKITVSSEQGKGSTFSVFVPRCTDCYEKLEFAEESENGIQLNYSRSMLEMENYYEGKGESTAKTATIDSFRALIVEDDRDMQKYIADELSPEYHVNVANNGNEGLTMVRNLMPDMIISDIMMPVMDGYELCRQVKSDELTSHIPVILLTAKSSEEHQIRGLEYGADDYITKPFNPNILKLRIRNILENRIQLAKKFSSELDPIPSNIKISEIDHGFLEKLVKFVENNIDNEELNGDLLASELGVSKGNLYKKLKALSGLTVNIFIRNIRLKTAAKLLKKGNYSISEIAYAVGFNNPKYFSTCFSELFGLSPKEYMQS